MDLLERAKQMATRITKAQHMEANLGMFERLGLDIEEVQTMAESVGLEADDLLLLDTSVSVVVKREVVPEPDDLPPEVSTEQAAKMLGVSKDTVLKFKRAGLLEYRNTAPPQSSRPVYRFSKESVLQLRTDYQTDTLPVLRERERRRQHRQRRDGYDHFRYDD